MIISMVPRSTREQVEYVCEKIRSFGYAAHPIYGEERVVIGAVGDGKDKDRIISVMESVPGVESVIPILQPFKLVGRELKKQRTVIEFDGFTIGGDQFVVMAGPCSVEFREQLLSTAENVKAAGAKVLRGGAYKPRTSPYDFQGLEEEGLKLLAEARERTGLKIITEIINTENVDLVNEYTAELCSIEKTRKDEKAGFAQERNDVDTQRIPHVCRVYCFPGEWRGHSLRAGDSYL